MGKIAAGKKVPDFTAKTSDGRPWRLADAHGSKLVIYFYPKADTPGCTKQACGVQEALPALGKIGLEVVTLLPCFAIQVGFPVLPAGLLLLPDLAGPLVGGRVDAEEVVEDDLVLDVGGGIVTSMLAGGADGLDEGANLEGVGDIFLRDAERVDAPSFIELCECLSTPDGPLHKLLGCVAVAPDGHLPDRVDGVSQGDGGRFGVVEVGVEDGGDFGVRKGVLEGRGTALGVGVPGQGEARPGRHIGRVVEVLGDCLVDHEVPIRGNKSPGFPDGLAQDVGLRVAVVLLHRVGGLVDEGGG